MTALSIIQDACAELSLDVPSVLFASTNDLDIQMRNLLNREVKELARRYAWTVLTSEQTFTTVAAAAQTSAVPSDFFWYIDETMFNRTSNRIVLGPLSAHEWQREQAGPLYTSIYDAFRFRGGDIIMTPTPTAGETVAYEYVTNLICTDSGGTGQTAYAADTDLSLLDEGLLTMGVKWRFKKAKGFDYAEDYAEYEKAVEATISRDGGRKRLSMTESRARRLEQLNIPEGNWS